MGRQVVNRFKVQRLGWVESTTALALAPVPHPEARVYYNPKIMLERAPGIVDWFEDIVFTGCARRRCRRRALHPQWR